MRERNHIFDILSKKTKTKMLLIFVNVMIFKLCLAQFNSFIEFAMYSTENNITITDYATKLGFIHFDRDFRQFKVIPPINDFADIF